MCHSGNGVRHPNRLGALAAVVVAMPLAIVAVQWWLVWLPAVAAVVTLLLVVDRVKTRRAVAAYAAACAEVRRAAAPAALEAPAEVVDEVPVSAPLALDQAPPAPVWVSSERVEVRR